MIAKQLNATRQAISDRLGVMERFKRLENGFHMSQTNDKWENCVIMLLLRHDRKGFLHRVVAGVEK